MANDHQRIHVAVLIDYAGGTGGAEALAPRLLERLDPARFEGTLVLYQPPAPEHASQAAHAALQERIEQAGMRLLQLNRKGRYDIRSWRPFVELLRRGGVDILHSHKFGPNLWATSFARVTGTPVVVAHEHTWSFDGAPARMFLDRWLIATGCDVFVAVSERDRERMERLERIPAGRVRLLPNGIPTPTVAVDAGVAAEIRAELDIPADAPIVGAIGVFRPQKDFGTLIRAFRLLLDRVPEAYAVVVGDGPEMETVRRLAREEGVEERVRLPGLRLDAVRIATAFDVAVNCSLFEGSALAVIEYMALGLPVVATEVGGTPDLLADGEAGVLVPPADPAALARAVEGLLAAPDKARALGTKARARQRQQYDIDVQVKRLEAMYEELYARAGGRRRRWRPRPAT
jgi:glycosyltransferase involved in cell wall biosynthesis